MKFSFLIIAIFVAHFSFGQYSFQMDTISIKGFLVAYVSKSDMKIKRHRKNKIIQMIDVTSGTVFFTQNEFSYIKPMNKEKISNVENKQNAIYLFDNNKIHSFAELNIFYLDGKYTVASTKGYYPNNKEYDFKDKKWFYKITKVKVIFLMFYVDIKDLKNMVNGTDDYVFNMNKIPIFIAQKIIDD